MINDYIARLMQGADSNLVTAPQPLGRSVGPTQIMARVAPSGGTWHQGLSGAAPAGSTWRDDLSSAAPEGGTWRQGLTGAAPMPEMSVPAHGPNGLDWLQKALDHAYSGASGERGYHPGYYATFVLDPDGNNIEAVCHGPG